MAPDPELAAGANHVNGSSENKETSKTNTIPYEANADTPKSGKGANWADVYSEVYDPSKSISQFANKDTPLPSIKTEPAGDDFETRSLGFDGTNDSRSSKTLASRKNSLPFRGASSERSSPAVSVNPSTSKKSASAATKKGTAKKPATKKRKANDLDTDIIDERRSNTPASRASKAPGQKQDSVSNAGSPVPEPKKRSRKRPKGRAADDDDDEEDENAIFCICRRPDNHTWMIGCDGGCEDWFHGKCVHIDPRDAELIEKYICPNCSQSGKGCTTWKPMCRLTECRKPARFAQKSQSKYCSDGHGQEYMRRQIRFLELGPEQKGQDDLGSMGSILTPGNLRTIITGGNSADGFRKLGNEIITPPPESMDYHGIPNNNMKKEGETPSDTKTNGDIHPTTEVEYSLEETANLEKIGKCRDELLHRKEMLATRTAFIALVRQRAKAVVEKLKQKEPKGGWKDICGFDWRLAWSDGEFDKWRLSEAGKKALVEGTAQALAGSYPTTTDPDGDTSMDGEEGDELAFLSRGICTKKRCERHKQWMKVEQQDIVFEENTADQDLARYEQDARSVTERAVLRKWAGEVAF
ncbi:uncharacterized protein N7483_001262 [Penicillium malachiteum]|uniref:uncharacterized protein n=1 Tax=Penicillium malachiteum TaxID=1324776 RepID=UPI002546CF6F|nr:uncharacterized protein N7483_001262 [Penicillium malachiteum]KAJ5736137.1 hypothetical protein N7483_001262 [Penicillium malachiteum]